MRGEGFSEDVLDAIDALTKRPDEKDQDSREEGYMRFIARAAQNNIARIVKLADVRDNCDLSRIASPTERDRARVAKYARAIEKLETAGRIVLPASFPPWSAFGDIDGLPVSRDELGFWTAWDVPGGHPISPVLCDDAGAYVTEAEFRAAVSNLAARS